MIEREILRRTIIWYITQKTPFKKELSETAFSYLIEAVNIAFDLYTAFDIANREVGFEMKHKIRDEIRQLEDEVRQETEQGGKR